MARSRINAATPEAALWRMDVEWPQDREPLLSVLQDKDLPIVAERLRKQGLAVTGATKTSIETALQDSGALARVANPQKGAAALALALLCQHPAGMDRDHLQFELALLLEDDRRTADLGLAGLDETGVVVQAAGRRGERYRVLPTIRAALAAHTAGWLDALERKGGAAGTGEVFGMRVKTTPGHVLALLVAWLGAHPPRLRSAALGTELHARDGARVLDALHHLMDRTLIPHMVVLAVRTGLARPNGTRLTMALDAPALLSAPPDVFWRRVLVGAVPPRSSAAVLRLLREPEPGFVPESTLRRALKSLHHTDQLLGGHPFPTDARGNEAAARADLETLRISPLLEQGRTPEGAPALRLHPSIHRALRGVPTASTSMKADGHVGADHELHIGPSAPPHLLAGLGLFAVPQVIDTVSRFTITPASVASGAARGVLPEQMEEILKELAARGLPDNVLRTLKDYGAPRGRAAFGRGLVLAFTSETDAQKARDDAELRSLLGEPLSATVFLVDSAREARARARLQELGLAVAEDTVMYTPGAIPVPEEESGDEDAPAAARRNDVRRASLLTALAETGAEPQSPARPMAAPLLHALTGVPATARGGTTASDGSHVVPLRAKKAAASGAVPVSSGTLGTLERAQAMGMAVRLAYTPEAGGGSETMTVEVVEAFERSGTPMVRVRFPKNPKAAERVLRVSRVAWVEPAEDGKKGSA